MVAGVGYTAIAGAPFSHWSSRIREADHFSRLSIDEVYAGRAANVAIAARINR